MNRLASAFDHMFERLEQSFQAYVHGDGSQGYLANYSHPVITLEELKKRKEEAGGDILLDSRIRWEQAAESKTQEHFHQMSLFEL